MLVFFKKKRIFTKSNMLKLLVKSIMQVHNICITASIVYKTFSDEEDIHNKLNWHQRKIQIFDNSIILKKKIELCLTKNIKFVLLLPGLKERFKERLEIEFHRQIL